MQIEEKPAIELTTALEKVEDLKRQLESRDKNEAIEKAIHESGDWAAKNAATGAAYLLRNQFKWDADKRALEVTDEQGHPLIGPNGPLSPAELVARFRAEHVHFTKQAHTPAEKKPAENPLMAEAHLRRLFGKESNGRYVQEFHQKHGMEAYRRLKAEAISKGIIKQ